MKNTIMSFAMLGLLVAVGCSQQGDETATPGPSANGLNYLLGHEPTEANDVVGVRETAKHGDAVVIVGRIGGSANPWIEDRAAFSIVDRSLKACSDIPGDACPIPWDYCCETDKLPTGTALVKVVDKEGNLVKEDARQLLGVKELATVVIKGKAERDKTGNLTILATHVFIKQE